MSAANTKKIAILQSNYIPWKGYFDMIAAVDEFILYDDMQYTRRDWRNRNQIKTPQGLQWLTVPVQVKGKYHQKIRETEIDGTDWAGAHWKALAQNYRRAPHFEEIAGWLAPIYLAENFSHISQLNRRLIEAVCNYLSIKTVISTSWDYDLVEGRTERLAELCAQAGGTEYISGPSAKDYIEPEVFAGKDIKLSWFDYAGYPEYQQLWGEFTHGVSILDLLFNCGKDSPRFMRFVK
ncbi:WbqC family protein [Pseudoduganella violaceinigra]|uniref:WbqC family protein n=1 Tax=Pseudoduganella violaceinigra TaxID=246602 RepID=UPI000406E0D9|nr:WbqC family protein [Pseudoduganella violaceinigra]